MKKCQTCNRTYADDTLSFCLEDGSLLSASYDSEATLVMDAPFQAHEIPTQVISRPVVSTKSSSFNLTHAVILILAILLAGIGVAFYYEKQREPVTAPITANVSQPTVIDREPVRTANSTATPNQTVVSNQNTSATRYSVSSCNSIKDSRTGLEWFVGPDRNVTWEEAQQWVSGMSACNDGWRMPSLDEIRTLYNPSTKAGTGYFTSGKYFPAKIDPVFNAIGGGSWVWSNQRSGANAQSFNLNQGKAVTYSVDNTLYSTRAFAVRAARN